MIRIFDKKSKNFNNTGLQILTPYITEAVVTEVINGVFVLEFKIIRNKSKYINLENIVIAPTPKENKYQAFRIKTLIKEMNFIRVTAYHITYDLVDNIIDDINIVNAGASTALDKISRGGADSHSFNLTTDIQNITNNCRIVRQNILQSLIGNNENNFINRWGGEIERNNFNISMKKRVGSNKGVQIRHKKNLLGYEGTVDLADVATVIIPKGYNGIMLPEKHIYSEKVDYYQNKKFKVIEYSDVKVKEKEDGEGLTKSEAYEELRRLARREFSEGKIDVPSINYNVNFIELSKTKEYKNFKNLESIYLGDTVKIIHIENNVDVEARVISYKYDSLSERYISVEIGNFKENFSDFKSKIESKINEFNNNLKKINKDSESALERAKNFATDLIDNGFGGNVKIYKDRVLIMDNKEESAAKKVWQWNVNGFGFSKTGVNGPYETAITMDGKIVADFITSGNLNANIIKSGRIEGKNFELDLDSGTAVFGRDSFPQDLINEIASKVKNKWNLISFGDCSRPHGMIDLDNHSTKNLWIRKDVGNKKSTYTLDKSRAIYIFVESASIKQYLNLEKNKKHYFNIKGMGNCEVFLEKIGQNGTVLKSRKIYNFDESSTKEMFFNFTTEPDSSEYSIIFKCISEDGVLLNKLILSDSEIKENTDWYPSIYDNVGVKGETGERGPKGESGDISLPDALKQWAGNATQINGKYVYTPELFVGNSGDLTSSDKNGIYIGSDIEVKFGGRLQKLTGMVGIKKGEAVWYFSDSGDFVIGTKFEERLQLGADGRAILPMIDSRGIKARSIKAENIETGTITASEIAANTITASEIKSGAITTDMLYPGAKQRIVFDRNANPGSNTAMSIDANEKAIRLKYNANVYFKASSGGSCEAYDYKTVFRASSNGCITWTGWKDWSDSKLKENLSPIDSTTVLRKNPKIVNEKLTSDDIKKFLKNSKFYNYNYIGQELPKFSIVTQGVSDEIKKVLVTKAEGSGEFESVDMYMYISMLHFGVKDLYEENKKLEKRIEYLEKLIKKE